MNVDKITSALAATALIFSVGLYYARGAQHPQASPLETDRQKDCARHAAFTYWYEKQQGKLNELPFVIPGAPEGPTARQGGVEWNQDIGAVAAFTQCLAAGAR